jgi:hypothetical protein
MNRLWAFGLVAMVLVGGLALAGPAAAQPGATNASSPSFGETQFVVTVYENGSARWTQRYNQPLANETRTQQFRTYAEEFNTEETPLYTDFRQRATDLTAAGSNATGRTMSARGFTHTAEVTSQPSTTGVVEMSFLWTNFTAPSDGGVTVGDTFENGIYLSPNMSIEIQAGPNLGVDWSSVEPTPDASTNGSGNTSDSLTYFGETQFASGQPRVTFTESSDPVGGQSMLTSPLPWAVLAIALAVVLGAVIVRRSSGPVFGSADEGETPPAEAPAGAESATRDGSGSDADADDHDDPATPAVTSADLRSDEDRIVEMLEANGGRMQQTAIVEGTGWSKSKVSTLLSEMADDGTLTKLRVGRENIVSLAGHEPTATRSPFDDE